MNNIYIVDHVKNNTLTQYGILALSYDDGFRVLTEAVHAYNMDDYWDNKSEIVNNPDENESLYLRTFTL